MKKLTRDVVFINTSPKSERVTVLKSTKHLKDLHDNDTNVFCKSVVDRYEHRPHQLANMCLAEFVENYQVKYNATVNDDDDDNDENDVMPPSDDIEVTPPKVIQLTDNFGAMVKRKTEAVIRFFKYSKDSDPSNYYRSRLMLYYPWYIEASDLLGGYESYEEHYNYVINEIVQNEKSIQKLMLKM